MTGEKGIFVRGTLSRFEFSQSRPSDESFERSWETIDAIEGWLRFEQGLLLHRAASQVKPGQWIVEIGSHHGRSTLCLASAKGADVPMMAIDPFSDTRWGGGDEAFQRFRANLAGSGLANGVELYRGLSSEAATSWNGEPIGLLFIDGAHDRQSVIKDIDLWEPRVAERGLVFFHDAFSALGTTEALTLRHLWSRHFRYVNVERTLISFRRERLSAVESVQSSLRVAARYPYFARNIAIKVMLRYGHRRLAKSLGYRQPDDLY